MKLFTLIGIGLLTVIPFIGLAHVTAVTHDEPVIAQNPPIANLNINSGEPAAADPDEPKVNTNSVTTQNSNSNNVNSDVSGVVTENQNTNSTQKTAPSDDAVAKLREPAHLLPLALIPLAVILYLIYRRLSWRKE